MKRLYYAIKFGIKSVWHAFKNRARTEDEYETYMARFTCASIGHSDVVFTRKGYIYCARCNTLIACAHCHKVIVSNKVILGANSKAQTRARKSLQSADLLNLPKVTRAQLEKI